MCEQLTLILSKLHEGQSLDFKGEKSPQKRKEDYYNLFSTDIIEEQNTNQKYLRNSNISWDTA